jgi:hypothetical protein
MFSLDTGRFETPNDHGCSALVDGVGARAMWTERGLTRLGWRIAKELGGADLLASVHPSSARWP